MFAAAVVAYRQRLGFTQEELAERAGLAVRTIRNIESGRGGKPRPTTVRLLADALGLLEHERARFLVDAVTAVVANPPVANSMQLAQMSALRYYIYISQTKLEILVPQLPSSHLRSLEAEIKVIAAALTTSVKKLNSVIPPELTAKTKVLSEYLRRQEGSVGTVAIPGRYVHGTAAMHYGVMRDYGAELAVFGGNVNGIKVCLIGSPASLIGAAADTTANHSINYYMLRFLYSQAGDAHTEPADTEQIYEICIGRALRAVKSTPNRVRLEFLAKSLFHNDKLMVGTPIYVAYAD